MLATATDLKRWKKVFHAAISSTALKFPIKTTKKVAYEGETFRDTWNCTAAIIEAIVGKPFARIELRPNEQFSIKSPPEDDWCSAFELLGDLAGRPETSKSLRWHLNWMRDAMFALGLSPERIEREAKSSKGLWWTVLRKQKENIALLDAKQQWGRQVRLEENQREERFKHQPPEGKAFSQRDILELMKPPPGHRQPTVWKGHKGLGLRDYTEPRRVKFKGTWQLVLGQKAITITRPIAEMLIRHRDFLPPALQRTLESIGRYYKIDTCPNFFGPSAPGPFGDPHDGTAIFHRSGRVRKGKEEVRQSWEYGGLKTNARKI